jgi:hypothetical protein
VLARLRSPWTWAVLVGVVVIVVVVALVVTSGGDDEEGAAVGKIERSPGTPIVIAAGEPIIVGVSAALTGPTGTQGSEVRADLRAGAKSARGTAWAVRTDRLGARLLEQTTSKPASRTLVDNPLRVVLPSNPR